jgi:sideroflexin-5
MVDLRNIFTSDAELSSAQSKLQQFQQTKRLPPNTTNSDLWQAKKIVNAAIHPDTGEKIPLVFRMCTFMPSNLPITAGMLLSTTVPSQLFWQWMNQSYNAGFNYANRNASVPLDMQAMILSYGVAAGTAVGMAFGMGKVVNSMQSKFMSSSANGGSIPFHLKLLSRGLPWFAVASAGAANALAMRYKEGIEGITIVDSNDVPVGTSVKAGQACLTQVALTRVVLPIPILLLPPFLLDFIRSNHKMNQLMTKSTFARVGIELSVIAVFLQCALPFAVALFPQKGSIPASALEPSFQNRKDKDGNVISTYYYNKGV